MDNMKDKTIICNDCAQEFVWSVGEQEFYKEKGVVDPKHCMICRGKHEAKKEYEDNFIK